MYVRVWEYDVDPGQVDAFLAAYGAEGVWAELFRRGHGYAGTELYRNIGDPTRFVTVDRWSSAAAWAEFLEQHGAPYEALDARLAPLSRAERALIEADADEV